MYLVSSFIIKKQATQSKNDWSDSRLQRYCLWKEASKPQYYCTPTFIYETVYYNFGNSFNTDFFNKKVELEAETMIYYNKSTPSFETVLNTSISGILSSV